MFVQVRCTRENLLTRVAAAAVAAATVWGSAAFAQTPQDAAVAPQAVTAGQSQSTPPGEGTTAAAPQEATPGDTPALLGDIVVTASRVNRQGYSAPTPTTVVGAEQLAQRGTTNVAQYLSEVPSFKATTNPTSNGIAQRSPGANYVDLRGLGPSRTLVLVDGNRFVPQIAAGLAGYQVDLNQIPALMVERVEVVTGGASAQWGSDAVAGVVNILLKKKFEGLQAEIQAGRTTHDDYGSVRAGIVGGTSFGDGRGNITAAFDYEQNFGVGDVENRDWGRKHYQITVNPCPNAVGVSAACPTGGNGQPVNLILPDVQFSVYAPGGLITNTALRGTTFGAGGTVQPFTYGQYVGSTNMVGGSQPGVYFPKIQDIASPFTRHESYARASYDLTDTISVYAEGSYSYSRGGGQTAPGRTTTTVQIDNAFLPTAIRDQMTQLGITSFNLGRANYEFVSDGDITNRTTRGVIGLEGTIPGDNNWKWSAAVGRGINKYKQRVSGATYVAHYQFAADAVAYNGQIVCRATIPGPSYNAAAAGCIPMNLFGAGSVESARSYVTAVASSDIDYKQTFANAELSGEPFSTWAGPVSLAVGGEYRRESQVTVADPVSNAAGYDGNNTSSLNGKFNVKEVFGELVVPLLTDVPLAESLELNGAVRYADYSGAAGGQTTWKVGATYRPFAGMLLRAARSRDIRAPNIYEQNVPANSRLVTISYGQTQPVAQNVTSGNRDLLPEKADTTTFGFSYQPAFVRGLAFSVDYFRIDTKDVISTLSGQDVADLCRVGQQQNFCDLITFSNAGVPTIIRSPYLNLASVDISGIDGQASYRLPLSNLGADLPGALQFNFAGTYTIHAKVNSGALGAATIDRAGETGPNNQFSAARFRFTGSITYSDSRFSISGQARHISAGKYDNTYTPLLINDNRVDGRTYFDLSSSYDLTEGVSAFLVVNNLLDRDPPVAPFAQGSPTNAIYFDTLGRQIKVGLRLKM